MQSKLTGLIGAAVVVLMGSAAAQAQYPEKPINVVVPAGPGSATDTVVRLVLNTIEEQGTLGQPLVVINVNGGPIAATRVRDAAPDGYEILAYHLGLLGTQAVGKIDFGVDGFEPIAQTSSMRFMVVAAENGPYDDFNALVEAAQAAPGTITEANSIGGASHIATLQLAQSAGYEARVVHVGDGPTRLQSVLGGHSAYTVVSPPEYKGFSGTGIKALANIGPNRSPDFPDVPATSELGVGDGIAVDTWWFAPPETPQEIVDQLASAIEQAMSSESLLASLKAQGVEASFLKGDAFAEHLSSVSAAVLPMGPALSGQ